MQSLEIPTYNTKEEVHADLDRILSYVEREDVYLASFKTLEFRRQEEYYNVVKKESIRNTLQWLPNYNVPAIPGMDYKIATCIFSENRKTYGLRKHFHLPKTTLPTITIGKKIFSGKDDVMFKFYRRNGPPNISLQDDFVLRFDSCTVPHEIVVEDEEQSIWLFIVFEHCGSVDLELVKDYYRCGIILDYFNE